MRRLMKGFIWCLGWLFMGMAGHEVFFSKTFTDWSTARECVIITVLCFIFARISEINNVLNTTLLSIHNHVTTQTLHGMAELYKKKDD